MASELNLSITFEYRKGSTSLTLSPDATVTVAGTVALHNRQVVGTSEEALVLGDVSSPGFLVMVNRDATNFVEIRPATGVADLIKLGPGEPFVGRLVASAPFVIADTAECEIEYVLLSA